MPTPNRQNYVIRKTRAEYRKHATLTDDEEIEFQLRLADTNLDTVLVQAEHLSRRVKIMREIFMSSLCIIARVFVCSFVCCVSLMRKSFSCACF
jgi:hypothetical protein